MKYDITEILLNPGKRIKLEVQEDDQGSLDESVAAPITGHLWFHNAVDALLVTGNTKSVLRLECSRCLELYDLPVEMEVDEQFVLEPLPAFRAGGHAPRFSSEESLDMTDLAANILEGSIFDVRELLRQLVLLETPFQPLCRSDCKGICPQCGRNLNQGDCGCT